eukprot:4899720-Pyramimonas_sp.AAC.1
MAVARAPSPMASAAETDPGEPVKQELPEEAGQPPAAPAQVQADPAAAGPPSAAPAAGRKIRRAGGANHDAKGT